MPRSVGLGPDGVVLGAVVFVVVHSQGHPLAGAQQGPVALLSGETVVMPPRPQFAGVWDGMVSHLLPGGVSVGQVMVEPDQLNARPRQCCGRSPRVPGSPWAILGIADHRGIDGIVVRPLIPALRLELEAVWRAPGRAAVGLLAAFLVDSSRDPRTVIEPSGRAGQAPVRA